MRLWMTLAAVNAATAVTNLVLGAWWFFGASALGLSLAVLVIRMKPREQALSRPLHAAEREGP